MKSQKLARTNLALKIAILESGRTQRATARRVPMGETRLSKIIAGKEGATKRQRKRLAVLTGKPEAELFAVAS